MNSAVEDAHMSQLIKIDGIWELSHDPRLFRYLQDNDFSTILDTEEKEGQIEIQRYFYKDNSQRVKQIVYFEIDKLFSQLIEHMGRDELQHLLELEHKIPAILKKAKCYWRLITYD